MKTNIITDFREAKFLWNVSELSIDIETDTNDDAYTFGKNVGLSYIANITWFACWDGNEKHPVLVLQMQQDDHDEKAEFIRELLSRPGLRLVGHNVGFDLRNLGGHYGFQVHIDSDVWDTQSVALLLMMSNNAKSGFALEVFEERLGLLTPEELAHSKRMKPLRPKLHEQPIEDVLWYVALDVLSGMRFYYYQRRMIDCTGDVRAQPYFTSDFQLYLGEGNDFLASKKYTALPELVNWETRIARWCANMSIRGLRLDVPYAEKHLEKMTIEYHNAVEQVVDAAREYLDDETLLAIQRAVDFEIILAAHLKGQKKKSVNKNVFRKHTSWEVKGSFDTSNKGVWSALIGLTADDYVEEFYEQQRERAIGYEGDFDLPEDALNFSVEQYIMQRVVLPNKLTELPDFGFRLHLLANWMRAYFKVDKDIDDDKMTNMKAFQPYYIFCVLGTPFPTNMEIFNHTEVVTTKIRSLIESSEMVEDEEDLEDFRSLASRLDAWSMDKKALTFYEKAAQVKNSVAYNAFYTMQKNHARISRSQELLKHALRDGRIHPLIARRAQTGRASCSLPNLMNIPFVDKVTREQVFTGYLIPDDDDSMLAGLDISNAENYFAAFSFGDNAMAEACAAKDFHLEMTKVYWPEQYKELVRRINAGDKDAIKALKILRGESKKVTFGDAYGSGDKKTARQIGATIEEAKAIKEQRSKRFPAIARGKKTRAEQAEKLYKAGVRPAYTTLWTGRRVFLDEVWKDKVYFKDGERLTKRVKELKSYTVTNYLQQGGVGELVWRAIVIADEYFERNGWNTTRVALQLHDETILTVPISRALEAARAVSQIVWDVVPEVDRLLTTVPMTQFIASFDNGNASKWGWRADREYPLEFNVYANMYGIHELREGEKEAPTWIVNAHPDDTTSADLIRYQYQRLLDYREALLAANDENLLYKVQTRVKQIRTRLGLDSDKTGQGPFEELADLLQLADPDLECLQPKTVKIGGHDYGKLNFAARMTLFQQGYLTGKLKLEDFHMLVINRIRDVAQGLPDAHQAQFRRWEESRFYGVEKKQ